MTAIGTTPAEHEAWLLEEVAGDVVALIRAMLADGRAAWQWDPEVQGVLGLVHADNRRKAYMVIYDNGADFELSEELEEMLWGS